MSGVQLKIMNSANGWAISGKRYSDPSMARSQNSYPMEIQRPSASHVPDARTPNPKPQLQNPEPYLEECMYLKQGTCA